MKSEVERNETRRRRRASVSRQHERDEISAKLWSHDRRLIHLHWILTLFSVGLFVCLFFLLTELKLIISNWLIISKSAVATSWSTNILCEQIVCFLCFLWAMLFIYTFHTLGCKMLHHSWFIVFILKVAFGLVFGGFIPLTFSLIYHFILKFKEKNKLHENVIKLSVTQKKKSWG